MSVVIKNFHSLQPDVLFISDSPSFSFSLSLCLSLSLCPSASLSPPQNLESEAPRQISPATPSVSPTPVSSWPQEGDIHFHEVEMRYRGDLPLVLKKLSFRIMPEETVGIVGRTGSGMMTFQIYLFSCLFVCFYILHIYLFIILSCGHLRVPQMKKN